MTRMRPIQHNQFQATVEKLRREVGSAPYLSSAGKGSGRAVLFGWRGEADEMHIDGLENAMVVLHAGGANNVGATEEGRRSGTVSTIGSVSIIPAGTRLRWTVFGRIKSLTLHLSPSAFATFGYTSKGRGPVKLQVGIQDPFIAHSLLLLGEELQNPRELGCLYADALTETITLHLLRSASETFSLTCNAGGLPPFKLRRARDLIESRLEEGISLDELSAELSLSRAHFSKAFRKSTGLAPHQYLTERRIAKGREMLAHTDESISRIALKCGFSSQAHFTDIFGRRIGATPLSFRHSHR